jgi:hypothetical protein
MGITRRLKGLLYESTPVEFRSAYGIAESVERLLAATKRSAFSALGDAAAVGKVSAESVRLQRVIPMVRNSFKPFFTGQFAIRDGVTVLTGQFGMAQSTKIFMTVWLGIVAFAACGMLLATFKATPATPHWVGIMPLLMVFAGLGLVALGKWFGRNDAAWLSGVISQALGMPVAGAAAKVEVDPAAVPMVLKWVAVFLAASAVMVGVTHFIGLKGLPALGEESSLVTLPLSQWDGAYAVASLVLAVGIWRRRPWGWWGGFLMLGLSIIMSLFAFPTEGELAFPASMRVIFGIFAVVVTGVWGRWWYAQRRHFLWAKAPVT